MNCEPSQENKRVFDKKRKKAKDYREGELVAIKRTQQGLEMKLADKYLGDHPNHEESEIYCSKDGRVRGPCPDNNFG